MQFPKDHQHMWEKACFLGGGCGYFCQCGASTHPCDECGAPLQRATDLDKAYMDDRSKVQIGYRCSKGHEAPVEILDKEDDRGQS